MAPQFLRTALFRFLPAVVLLIVTAIVTSPAAAVECQRTDVSDGGTLQGLKAWNQTPFNIPPLTITVQRDVYEGILSSSLLEDVTPMKRSRLFDGNRENRRVSSIDTCWSQYVRKGATIQQAMIKSFGKSPAKAFAQIMRLGAFPYNGKRLVMKTGLTVPEVVISAHDPSADMIGPVLENRNSDRSGGPGLNQANTLSLFEGSPVIGLEPHLQRPRMPLNESLRMDRTTTRVLHGGNCPNACP